MLNLSQTPTISGTLIPDNHASAHIHANISIQTSGSLSKYGAIGIGAYLLPRVAAGGVAYSTPNGITFPLLELSGRARYGLFYELIPMSASGTMHVYTPPLSVHVSLPSIHVRGSAKPVISLSCTQYKLQTLVVTCQSNNGSRMAGAEALPKLRVSGAVVVPQNIAVLPKPSITGTFARPKFFQGNMVLPRMCASGVPTLNKAYTILKPVVRASLQTAFTHTTGEYRLHSVTVVGHATHYAASGKCQLPKLRATGTASHTVTLSAKMQLPKVAAHGSFSYGASVVLRKVQVHASVTVGRTLRGAYTVQKLRAIGTGVAAKSAPGLVRIYKPKVYGAVIVHRNTLGGCPFKAARATGAIKIGKALSAVYQSPRFKIVGRAGYTGNASTRYVLRKAVVNGAMICHRHT